MPKLARMIVSVAGASIQQLAVQKLLKGSLQVWHQEAADKGLARMSQWSINEESTNYCCIEGYM